MPDPLFSDREYRCLGQWEEDGLLYVYTERMEIPGYECFVGKVDTWGRVKLAEGGTNCKRGLRLDMFGMTLTKKSMYIITRTVCRIFTYPRCV